MEPRLIIDRKTFKLTFFNYSTEVYFKGLSEDRNTYIISESGAKAFDKLLQACYRQCKNENELQHYLPDIRQFVGEYLFDLDMCVQLRKAILDPNKECEEG